MSREFAPPPPDQNPKTIYVKGQGDRTYFCSCNNTCTYGSGAKRFGCPCRDQSLPCTKQCTCGKEKTPCHHKETVASVKTARTKQDGVSGKQNTSEKTKESKNHCHTDSHGDLDGNITNITTGLKNVNIHGRSTGANKTTQEISMVHKITKGFALIIHNKYFDDPNDIREGSEKDVVAIKAFCKSAGIDINVGITRKTEDLTAIEIEVLCDEVSQQTFDAYDGFLCFILSHGKEEGILGVGNVSVNLKRIIYNFRDNRSLNGKPKLFFIQACRGSSSDNGIQADGIKQRPLMPSLPSDSDFLIAHSTVAGHLSYRFTRAGTLFIIKLIEQLKEHAHYMHLMDILTIVNREIAEYEIPDGKKVKKQMSCQLTTLTRYVHFNMPAPGQPSKKY